MAHQRPKNGRVGSQGTRNTPLRPLLWRTCSVDPIGFWKRPFPLSRLRSYRFRSATAAFCPLTLISVNRVIVGLVTCLRSQWIVVGATLAITGAFGIGGSFFFLLAAEAGSAAITSRAERTRKAENQFLHSFLFNTMINRNEGGFSHKYSEACSPTELWKPSRVLIRCGQRFPGSPGWSSELFQTVEIRGSGELNLLLRPCVTIILLPCEPVSFYAVLKRREMIAKMILPM